jgi:hypothetical protein
LTIGQLYNSNNVMVGQAACLVAPPNTPCPPPSAAVMTDPFSLAPWAAATLTASAALTAGTFILTYTYGGTPYTTAAIQYNATAAAIQAAVVAALATFPTGAAQTSEVTVTGGPLTTPLPVSISLAERLLGGVWTITPTGITGGTVTLTSPLWIPIGATDQGWTFASNKTTQSINIEEQSTPVAVEVTTQTLTVSGQLSEDVTQTLAIAYNMLSSVTAPGSGPGSNPGYTLLNPTDTVINYAVALIMSNHLSYPRWLYIPQATALQNVSAIMRRAAAKRMYQVDFSSVCPIASIAMYDFTAPHS